ncbi:MAG: hypothetical protein ACOX81_02620 [Candidatus Heteroscillospira sp.]|jgi:hypothetical protein
MNKDLERVRALAREVREIADLDIQKKNISLWKGVNDRKMIRPTVLTRDTKKFLLSQGTTELDNQCQDPFYRAIESDLLRTLYDWRHIRGDMVVESFYRCGCVIKNTGFGLTPAATNSLASDNESYSRAIHFDPIIKGWDDLEMIKLPQVEYDETATKEKLARTREALDGILDVKLFGQHAFRAQIWDNLLSWTGLQEGMLMFYTDPDFMHALADRMIDAFVSQVTQYEQLGILSSNNTNLYTGTGGYGYSDLLPAETESGIGARMCDIWGQVQDQILTSIGPEMTREFAFEHESRYAGLFHSNYYGCCEKLDHKISELSAIPRLRKISVSPFSDKEAAMEAIGDKYIVSFKPNNIWLTDAVIDEDKIRRELTEVLELSRKYNCTVEILIKTIVNLRGDPTRLWRWFEIADEVIRNY